MKAASSLSLISWCATRSRWRGAWLQNEARSRGPALSNQPQPFQARFERFPASSRAPTPLTTAGPRRIVRRAFMPRQLQQVRHWNPCLDRVQRGKQNPSAHPASPTGGRLDTHRGRGSRRGHTDTDTPRSLQGNSPPSPPPFGVARGEFPAALFFEGGDRVLGPCSTGTLHSGTRCSLYHRSYSTSGPLELLPGLPR